MNAVMTTTNAIVMIMFPPPIARLVCNRNLIVCVSRNVAKIVTKALAFAISLAPIVMTHFAPAVVNNLLSSMLRWLLCLV